MMYLKYKVYCLKDINGNVKYVGMTSRSLHDMWINHCKVYKHRKNYIIELIHQYDRKDDAVKAETFFIKYYDTVNNGENISYGVGRLGLGATDTSFKAGNLYGTIPTHYFICNETGDVGTAKELSELLGCYLHHIYDVAKGTRKTTHGYTFSYISKETFNELKAIPR